MKIYEVGTGYTSIPAKMGAATEIVVEELTKSFIKEGVDTTLIDIEDSNRLQNELPINEVKMPFFFSSTDVKLGIMHKLKRVIYSIMLANKLKAMIKQETEDILIHFHNQYNMYFFCKLIGKKLRKKVKIAYTVHSYIWPAEWMKIKETIQKRYFQEVFSVKNADYVLVLNDKTKENFIKYLEIKPEKIYKVVNGVNTDVYFSMDEYEVEMAKKSLDLHNKHIIFQVGSVCERKNQLDAVKMLSEYLKNNKDVVYMYAGGIIDINYKEAIDEYAIDNNISEQIIYAGELCPGEQLNKYYNMADVTIFPSKIESFGLVIIESLSSGTPVILSDEPLFELYNGYSVFRSDKEFFDIINKYIGKRNKNEELRSEVAQKYGWNSVAIQHLNIFEN